MYLPTHRDVVQEADVQILNPSLYSSYGNGTLPIITEIRPHPHNRHSQALSQATIVVLCLFLILAVALLLVLYRVLLLQRRDTTGSLRGLPLPTRLSKALGLNNRKRDGIDRSDSGSLISDVEGNGRTDGEASLPLRKRIRSTSYGNIFSRRVVRDFSGRLASRKKSSHRKNSSSISRADIRTAVPSSWIYETSPVPVILPMTRLDKDSRPAFNHQAPSSKQGSSSTSSGTTFSNHSHSNSAASSFNRTGSISSPSASTFSGSLSDPHSHNGFRTTPPQSPLRALYPSAARRGSNFSSESRAQVIRRESVGLSQPWNMEIDQEHRMGEEKEEGPIFVIGDAFPTPQTAEMDQFSFPAQYDPSASPKSSRILESSQAVPRLCASESFQRLVASDQSFGYEDPCSQPLQSSLENYSMNPGGLSKITGGGVWNWTGAPDMVSEDRRGSSATTATVHASSNSRRPSWLDGHHRSNSISASLHPSLSLRRPSAGPLPTPDQVHVHAPGHSLTHHMHLQGLSQPLPESAPPILKQQAAKAAASAFASKPPPSIITSQPISVSTSSPLVEENEIDSEAESQDAEPVLRRFRGAPPMMRSTSDAPSALSLPR